MLCRQCGNEVADSHKFCGYCGAGIYEQNVQNVQQESSCSDPENNSHGGQEGGYGRPEVSQNDGSQPGPEISRNDGWQPGPVQNSGYGSRYAGENRYPSAVSVQWEPETLFSSAPKGRGKLKLKKSRYQVIAIILAVFSAVSWLSFMVISDYNYTNQTQILLYMTVSFFSIVLAAVVRKGPITALPALVVIVGEVLMWWVPFSFDFEWWNIYVVIHFAVLVLTTVSILLFLSGVIQTVIPAFIFILMIEFVGFVLSIEDVMIYIYEYGLVELGYFLLEEAAFFALYASIAVAFANLTREQVGGRESPFL